MRYEPSLDGMRALAALAVLGFHAGVPGFAGGFLGVDVFFVLSSYLITSILAEEQIRSGRINQAAFLSKRLWRLYPALLLLLALYAIVAPALYPKYDAAKHYQDVLVSGLYITNYVIIFDQPLAILRHTWSLAVEMQFYLIWPVSIIVLLSLPLRRAVGYLMALWVLMTLWRWYGFYVSHDPWDIYFRADTHATGLILGAWLALVKPTITRMSGALAMMMLAVAVFGFGWRAELTALFGFSVAEIAAAVIIVAPPAWFTNAVLVWIGKMSYGLYLWHYPVTRLMQSHNFEWQVTAIAGLLAGLVLAAISYYLVEWPIQRHRKRQAERGSAVQPPRMAR